MCLCWTMEYLFTSTAAGEDDTSNPEYITAKRKRYGIDSDDSICMWPCTCCHFRAILGLEMKLWYFFLLPSRNMQQQSAEYKADCLRKYQQRHLQWSAFQPLPVWQESSTHEPKHSLKVNASKHSLALKMFASTDEMDHSSTSAFHGSTTVGIGTWNSLQREAAQNSFCGLLPAC